MKGQEWNPRFVAYAASQGRTPEAQLECDDEKYPGGRMCGFICWIAARLKEFKAAHPELLVGGHVSDQGKFTAYLEGKL